MIIEKGAELHSISEHKFKFHKAVVLVNVVSVEISSFEFVIW